jgi:hypothetical protein
VLAVAAILMAITGCGSSGDDSSSTTEPTSDPKAPVFQAPEDTAAAIERAGLTALPEETLEYHVHPVLRVFIDERRVRVPPDIGIDQKNRMISPLHTHDATGTVHVEAPEPVEFTLKQFFQEWDVELDEDCIASYCTDDTNRFVAFVDGEEVADPAGIVLEDEEQIVLWYGPKDVEPEIPE